MIKKISSKTLIGGLYLISLLPFPVIYGIADLLFVIVYYVIRYRRGTVDQNLANAFPERSSEERELIRKKYFRYLADLVMETIKLATISEKEVIKRVRVSNAELIRESFQNGRSVIGVLGHYGNWEIGALRFSQLYTEKRIIVYRTLSNIHFDELLLKIRSRFGATLVRAQSTARTLVELKNERTVTVMVGDQTPARSEIQYFTNFLNQPTAVYLGVEKLAKLTGSTVLFCDVRRVKRGYYECVFKKLTDDPKKSPTYEITDTHVGYLEEVIRAQPAYWLWSHRRWKSRPEDIPKKKSCLKLPEVLT